MAAHLVENVVTWIIETFQTYKPQLTIVAIGMVVGLLVQMILPGKGFGLVGTFLIGIIGCWLGNMFLHEFVEEYITFTKSSTVHTVIGGTIGGIIFGFVVNLFRTEKQKDKTKYRNNP